MFINTLNIEVSLIMKQLKSILITLVFCFMLAGCSSSKNIDTPYSVAIGSKTISYYDEVSSIDEKYGNVSVGFSDSQSSDRRYTDTKDFEIVFNEDKIRAFFITSENVTTMHGIHVGDNVSKVEDSFEYENNMGNVCEVLFDGETEINEVLNRQNDWIWIFYGLDKDGTITEIIIADNLYTVSMQ